MRMLLAVTVVGLALVRGSSVLVVSPTGSDTDGDGTVGKPLQTVAACVKKIASSSQPGGQCRLR